MTAAEMRPLVEALFASWNLVAHARLPRWEFDAKETEALVDAWTPVAVKYGGDFELGPELGAAIVTLAICAPRLQREPDPKPSELDEPGGEREAHGYRVQ